MKKLLQTGLILFFLAILAGGLLVISPAVLGAGYLGLVKSRAKTSMKIFSFVIFITGFFLVSWFYNHLSVGAFTPIFSIIMLQFLIGVDIAWWIFYRHGNQVDSSWLNMAPFLETDSETEPNCSSLKKSFKRMLHEGISGEKITEALAIIIQLPSKDKLRCLKKLGKKIFSGETPQQVVDISRLIIQTERRLKREKAVNHGRFEEAKRLAILLKDKLSSDELQIIFEHNRRKLPVAIEIATLMAEPKRGENLARLFKRQLKFGQVKEALQIVEAMSTQSAEPFFKRVLEAAIFEGEPDILVDVAERLGIEVSESQLKTAELIKEVRIAALTKSLNPGLNPSFP